MTQFIDVNRLSDFVRQQGAAPLIERLVGYLEADFRRWPEFDKSARLAAHSEVGVIELMPVADACRYAFKYVNGHPANTAEGLMTVMAFGVLADVATGYPLLLSELTLTTALRTAATSVMAARRLARTDARSMAIIGNGSQSEFQVLAFYHLMGIDQVRCYDVDRAASEKLVNNLAHLRGLKIRICDSAREATRGADIVTTVTADKKLATILTADMIEPGMHINGVGGDCPGKTELHRDVLTAGDIFVEFTPQTRIEGDIQQLSADYPVTELWQVLCGARDGRRSAEQITIFDSVGFALEDFSALRMLHDLAREHQLGIEIPLIPALADPKDLYQLVQGSPSLREVG